MDHPPSLPSGPRTICNGWRWDKCEPKKKKQNMNGLTHSEYRNIIAGVEAGGCVPAVDEQAAAAQHPAAQFII